MGIYTFPVMLVGGIGLLAGVILAAASKFFAVEVDERVTKIRECPVSYTHLDVYKRQL